MQRSTISIVVNQHCWLRVNRLMHTTVIRNRVWDQVEDQIRVQVNVQSYIGSIRVQLEQDIDELTNP
jgi:hypothetical protein